MKKKIKYIWILVVVLVSCDIDNVSDCFQSTGAIISTEFQVEPFTKIRFENDISLVLKQDSIQQVVIETGEGLLNNIQVKVENGVLIIQDNNSCNLAREYAVTKAYVSVPNLTEIRNSSSRDVTSNGILNFPNLKLMSNTTGGNIEGEKKSGDFILHVLCDDFRVSANGQSIFYITGESKTANLKFTDEWPRFEGENFKIDTLSFLQRSATYMKVFPLNKVSGEIRGTGDVILVNRPDIIEVEEFFTGKLIIQD